MRASVSQFVYLMLTLPSSIFEEKIFWSCQEHPECFKILPFNGKVVQKPHILLFAIYIHILILFQNHIRDILTFILMQYDRNPNNCTSCGTISLTDVRFHHFSFWVHIEIKIFRPGIRVPEFPISNGEHESSERVKI